MMHGSFVDSPVAVVGMAALFPGAPDLATYWANVAAGVDAITEVPTDRWDAAVFGAHPEEPPRPDRFPCRRGGFIQEGAGFDPQAFGIMPVAIADSEPDQLLALKVAAAAIDDGGGPDRLLVRPERAGVVLGRGGYLTPGLARIDQRVRVANQVSSVLRDVLPNVSEADLERVRVAFQDAVGPERPEASIGLVPNLAASRIANRLDLQGPAFTIDAACASSLVAIDHAVRELRSGRCDVMLAGGTHHCHDVTLWSVFTQLGALSTRQRIRPFDREADGLLIGEGTGVVVLKRLEDAEADGDRIYAVVRGTGVASDGRDASLMKPKVGGQVLALERAWADAGRLDPATIGLVEAHGTATPAGDSAELATLAAFFGGAGSVDADAPVLGSVKSMIGHAMPAAGIAGFIKAVAALHHRVLPPTLHVDTPHPALADTRFRVCDTAEPWELRTSQHTVRRAAVNAFGFGGINAHVVIDEAPGMAAVGRFVPMGTALAPAPAPAEPTRASEPAAPADTVWVFAGPDALSLLEQLDGSFDDVLARHRFRGTLPQGPARLTIVDANPKRLALARKVVAQGSRWLGRNDVWFSPAPQLGAAGGTVAFLFPGVEPTFDPRVADIAEWLDHEPIDLGGADHLGYQGRAIVAVGRLLHRALGHLGVRPGRIAGHSVGEWTGMIASELIPPHTVDQFIESIDPGTLEVPGVLFAAMGCGADVSAQLIDGLPDVVVSHDNCPHQSIICGSEASVRTALERGKLRKVLAQELPFRSGFHSPMFEPYLTPIRGHLDRLPLQAPVVPLWSATTVAPYPDQPDDVRDLAVRHLLEPVRFRPLLEALYADGVRAVVQLGVGSLTAFADDTLRETPILSIAATTPKRAGLDQLRRVLAGLWTEGLDDVRFDLLDRDGSALVAPTAASPSGGNEILLDLGAPWIRLPGLTVAPRNGGIESIPGSSDFGGSGVGGSGVGGSGVDDHHPLRRTGDPLLAELDGVLAEARRASEDVMALLRGTTPSAGPGGQPFVDDAVASDNAVAPDNAVTAADAFAPAARSSIDEHVRTMEVSTATMPWLLDHCFYRQPEHWNDESDLFPVVPMTAMLDLFTFEAEALVPDHVAVAITDIRALRWTSAAPPIEVVVKATRKDRPDGGIDVKVVLEGYARGTVRLAERYPEPPPSESTPLANDRPSIVDATELYLGRWMFHGPSYQGITEILGVADNGIRGVIEAPDAPGSLLDNAGQLMGYWVMQAVDHDRLALPMSVGSVEFYGPPPAPRTPMTCTVWFDRLTEEVARSHMELRQPDGAVWCRITDWDDKRFDSDDVVWPLLRYPERYDLGEEHRGGWVLVRERWRSSASRELMMRRYTNADERAEYDRRTPHDQRSWLLGRIAVKDAVRRSLWHGSTDPADRRPLFPVEVGVEHDEAGKPTVVRPSEAVGVPVSLAHTEWLAVAIAGEPDGLAVGIDIERVAPRQTHFAAMTLSDTERGLLLSGRDQTEAERDLVLTRLWAVKEAAAKAAGTGLQGQPKRFAISEVDGPRHRVGDRWIDTTTISTTEGEYVVAWTLIR